MSLCFSTFLPVSSSFFAISSVVVNFLPFAFFLSFLAKKSSRSAMMLIKDRLRSREYPQIGPPAERRVSFESRPKTVRETGRRGAGSRGDCSSNTENRARAQTHTRALTAERQRERERERERGERAPVKSRTFRRLYLAAFNDAVFRQTHAAATRLLHVCTALAARHTTTRHGSGKGDRPHGLVSTGSSLLSGIRAQAPICHPEKKRHL